MEISMNFKRLLLDISMLVIGAIILAGLQFGIYDMAFGNPLDEDISSLQHDWAKAYYQTPDKQKNDAFDALSARAHMLTVDNPGHPEPMIWEAIILSSSAKFSGGLSALGKAKTARDLLDKAEKIDPTALNGSIYTSLGSLYYKVPGWPIGFGDKEKAKTYLEMALKINPDGIDPNYFYGDFLLKTGDKVKAKEYLEKALAAPARHGREDADQGRKTEVEFDLVIANQT
jgi:tetratricopeptide (TPR) repeat protein